MSIDFVNLAQSAVAVVQPALMAVGTGVAGNAVWDWVKSKLTGAGHAEVVVQVEQDPNNDLKWSLLAATLAVIISEREELAGQLTMLIGKAKSGGVQTATGDGNVQIQGDNINIQR